MEGSFQSRRRKQENRSGSWRGRIAFAFMATHTVLAVTMSSRRPRSVDVSFTGAPAARRKRHSSWRRSLRYILIKLRYILIAAGPTRTMKIPGKMKITSGKIIFTAVFAAFSSAI